MSRSRWGRSRHWSRGDRFADELNKLSQKIGISVEALSTLQFAAQLSDVGLESQKGPEGTVGECRKHSAGLGGAQICSGRSVSVEDAVGNLKAIG